MQLRATPRTSFKVEGYDYGDDSHYKDCWGITCNGKWIEKGFTQEADAQMYLQENYTKDGIEEDAINELAEAKRSLKALNARIISVKQEIKEITNIKKRKLTRLTQILKKGSV